MSPGTAMNTLRPSSSILSTRPQIQIGGRGGSNEPQLLPCHLLHDGGGKEVIGMQTCLMTCSHGANGLLLACGDELAPWMG